MDILLIIVFSLLLMLGFLFIFLPVLPSVPYMFFIALVFDIIEKDSISKEELTVFGVITVLSILVDYLSGIIGAKWGGASWRAMMMGSIGMLIGMLVLPPLGAFIGLFIGVMVGELFVSGDASKAVRAASTGLIGSITGVVVNFILCLLFLVLFLVYVLN